MQQSILLIGLFLSEKNKHKIYRTAADQLAELLHKNNYFIIKASTYVNKIPRFVHTIFSIIFNSSKYSVAIVPLYGGTFSLFWAEAATVFLKLFRKKIILIIHGGSIPTRMENDRKAKNYLRTIQKAHVVVCPSNYIIHHLQKHGVNAVLIENVLNLSEYSFHEKKLLRPTLFWMRTFEDVYNPLMAVRVLAILQNTYPSAKMIMAGRDAGLLEETKQLAQKLNVIDKIVFPGYIDNTAKNNIAQEYDIYICTNSIDNAPVSTIEMMSLGLPVVSTNVGGIPFIVTNNKDGLLVNLNDDEGMVSKIALLIENINIAEKIIQEGLNTSKKYDEEIVIKKWNKIFKQLNFT
ncbi:MAG: glycosyltransferase family 4 protein [Chitinophagaceae bacterium]|nr:glycosyltransferase family 4 protein [Chitinophagaceae bacterium]